MSYEQLPGLATDPPDTSSITTVCVSCDEDVAVCECVALGRTGYASEYCLACGGIGYVCEACDD